jgi:hypothetical protein
VLQKLEKHTQNIRNQFYYVEIHEFTDIADLGQHLLTLITYLTPGIILASTTTKWAPTVGFVGFVSPAFNWSYQFPPQVQQFTLAAKNQHKPITNQSYIQNLDD